MLRLGIDGHGDHSTKLFADHKLCYDGQWLLAGHYFKHCLKLFITNTYYIYAAGTFCIHLVPNVGLDYSPKKTKTGRLNEDLDFPGVLKK